MDNLFEHLPFRPADILLPKNCDLSLWPVVACDQYTSQPEYWQGVKQRVGDAPSTLHLILPEIYLNQPAVESEISRINQTMQAYLQQGRFAQYPESIFYIERTLDSGKVRRGLIGMVDLQQYDYAPNVAAPVRATEGTVLARIPPRVAVREHAPIELPHVMLLLDDPQKTVIEPFQAQIGQMSPLYDVDLMEHGGTIKGWRLSAQQQKQVAHALAQLADTAAFSSRYHVKDQPLLLFAVGDGNHSLATAKACYEQQKKLTPPAQWDALPARFALCELGNLHDDSLVFEPIHRAVFGVEVQALLEELRALAQPNAAQGAEAITCVWAGGREQLCLKTQENELVVGALQRFLDEYLMHHAQASIDYIHGDEVAAQLGQQPNTVAFLLPVMKKEELFPAVISGGSLPRKTFSMGDAQDKRFYLEARKIRD